MVNKVDFISKGLQVKPKYVEQVCQMAAEGATLPFMARYRKEATGGMDELQIDAILKASQSYEALVARKETVRKAMVEQGATDKILEQLNQCWDETQLEDLYLPFKKQRKTKADKAIALGLEPLARILLSGRMESLSHTVKPFIRGEVKTQEQALDGALDLMAFWLAQREKIRSMVRESFAKYARVRSEVKDDTLEQAPQFKQYFKHEESAKYIPSHRLLALLRGEDLGVLKLKIRPDRQRSLDFLKAYFSKGSAAALEYIHKAVHKAYLSYLEPQMETELRKEMKAKADAEALEVFAKNLNQLLLQPPLGQKRILGIDPGFASGCKLVCLDEHGSLLHNETIYPHAPKNQKGPAASKIRQLVEAYKIEAIAVGNGTAGRETEQFLLKQALPAEVEVYNVNEDGASVYSASPLARKEFPKFDLTVRGAVSIGRRLMDPLAELVKIPPQSLGVGQYQHDISENLLKDRLGLEVERVVNQVGVDLNTASAELLKHVSGLGSQLAEHIVQYREEHGKFSSRQELLKVPRLGAKAFEQSAGFLRISSPKHPLDQTGVHPERYGVLESFAQSQGLSLEEMVGNDQIKSLDWSDLEQAVGEATCKDIIEELLQPNRDPREHVKVFRFNPNISSMKDLKTGMKLPGVVTNITQFGAFVDIGIKENGLLHLSQMGAGYVADPHEVVAVNQQLTVEVIGIDMDRKRIQLSIK